MQEKVENLFKPNKQEITQHLEFLFGDCRGFDDGLIEIAYTPSNSPAVNQSKYFEATDIEEAAKFAYTANSKDGVNVYVGAALRSPDTAPFGRSNTSDYYAAYSIWCDLDDAEAAKTAKDKYKDLPPSLVIVTGREPNTRAQVWWKLQTLEEDASLLKEKLGHICNALGGDPAVVDPARVMRLGGTIAYPKKDGRVIEKTEVIIPPTPTKMVNINKFNSYFTLPEGKSLISKVETTFKNPITGTNKISELLENSRLPEKWHWSMVRAISSMVGKGWSDEQIHIAVKPYLRDRSLVEDLITDKIVSARNKHDHPEPAPKIEQLGRVDPETGEVTPVVGKAPMYYIKGSDMSYEPDNNDFVQGLLEEGAMSVVYGESNCGKTFFMTDLSYHIAQGKKWRDKRVEGGAVVYVALEGIKGLSGRVAAYKKEYGESLDNFLVVPCPFDFLDAAGDVTEFLALVDTIKSVEGDVKLIVIDTLARAMGGADENSGQDMGLLVKHADAIREISGAHICFVHHSGKDTAKGARGHSSLRAAIDTEIEVSRTEGADFSEVKIVKQREMEMGDDMFFKLQSVSIGVNKYNEEKTSCVVIPCEEGERRQTTHLTAIQKFVYDAIVFAVDTFGYVKTIDRNMPAQKVVSYDEMREILEERGYKEVMATKNKTTEQQIKSATQSARVALKKQGKINFNKDYVWLANDGGE